MKDLLFITSLVRKATFGHRTSNSFTDGEVDDELGGSSNGADELGGSSKEADELRGVEPVL